MKVPVTRYVHLQLLCLFLLITVAAVSAPLLGAKGGQVPFSASFDTVFQVNSGPPILNITVQGEGQAQHMGRTRTFTTNQIADLTSGHTAATYTLIAANGDTLVIRDETHDSQPNPTSVNFVGTYTVVGGTGRFAGASGSGALIGSAQFTGSNSGFGEFTLDGTISSPDSLK